jgi:hypothetical protein
MSTLVPVSTAVLAAVYLAAAATTVPGMFHGEMLLALPPVIAVLATVSWAGTGFLLALLSIWLFHRSAGSTAQDGRIKWPRADDSPASRAAGGPDASRGSAMAAPLRPELALEIHRAGLPH